MDEGLLTVGAVSGRTGVAASALRFHEAEGLVTAARSGSGQRRCRRDALRRISSVCVAQQVGLSLDEARTALASLPDGRTKDQRDWARVSASWRPTHDARSAMLERLGDGPGPRHVLDEDR